MIRRTFSTVILWTALGGILFLFGAHAGVLLILLLALFSQYELYKLLDRDGTPTLRIPGLAAGGALILGPYVLSMSTDRIAPLTAGASILAIGLVLVALCALARPQPRRVQALATTALGLSLVAFPLHFFVQVLLMAATPEKGLLLALWVIVVVKVADIGAYVFGSLFGKHKLAPELSPGKTWEGVAGGMASSMLLGAAFVALFSESLPAALTPVTAAAFILPIAAVSVPSDLLESVFKRHAGVKDSGTSIPGIGGAYDLSDSLILSAPVAYVLLILFIYS